MIAIRTDRLLIRNFATGDAEPLWGMIQEYEASAYGGYDHPWPAERSEYDAITEWFANGDSYLAACLQDSGRFVGFVSLNKSGDGDGEYGLGYCFDFSYHGQGYATEACRAVLDHVFVALSAQRVTSGTAAVNQPSRRLLERLGFRLTGTARVSFRQAADGSRFAFDGCTYVLAREDWHRPG
jgi:RimJ/RimL family protein N-acetyltransferase